MMKMNTAELGAMARKLTEKLKNSKYMLLVLLCGLVLILLPSRSDGDTEAQAEPGRPQETVFMLEEEEKKLEDMLSKIDGAGKVQVMLTLKTSTEQILARDEDSSYESGEIGNRAEERSFSTVIISAGGGKESGVTLKYIYPQYLGALVVAEGADSRQVKLELTDAVSSLTGLGTDKITVTKMKGS